jgi:hypothetical protein
MDSIFMHEVSVRRVEAGYRVGLRQQGIDHDGADERAVLYDTTGAPLVVYRVLGGQSDGCTQEVPMVTEDGAWFGVDAMVTGKAAYVRTREGGGGFVDEELSFHQANQGIIASDDLYALWGLGAASVTVYDRMTAQAHALGGLMPSLTNDAAFTIGVDGDGAWHGYAWSRDSSELEPLVDVAAGATLAVFGSDGTTVAWIAGTEAPRSPPQNITQASLWTSPFAVHKADLVPTLRGPVADVAGTQDARYARVHRGHLAYPGSDGRIHVYRLSDIRHWSFESPVPGGTIGYVDEDEVWLWTNRNLVRQQLAALGEGEAPQ